MRKMRHVLAVAAALTLTVGVVGCDDSEDPTTDTTITDTSGGDTSTTDTSTTDTSTTDTNVEDTNTEDTNTGDTNTGDTNTGDTNTGDTNTGDTSTTDTSGGDTSTTDTSTTDTNMDDMVVVSSCTAVGEACDASVPHPGFVCVDNDQNGEGVCATACTVPGQGQPDPCGQGALCVEDVNMNGYCFESQCSDFFGDECGAGNKCVPFAFEVWGCVANGAATDGQTCEFASDCADGLLCSGAGTCFAPECNANNTCTAPESCQFFEFAEGPIDLGTCVATCTPWTGNECPTGEWCFPDLETLGEGQCVPTGTATVGDACDNMTTATTCEATTACGGGDTCIQLCDYTATMGPGATCAAGEACAQAGDGMGGTLEVGLCQGTCDFHAGTACPDAGDACLLGELFGQTDDVCAPSTGFTTLNTGDSCTAAGLVANDLCGPNSFCADISQAQDGSEIVCLDACATSEGAFNSTHPDCRIATQTCQDVGVMDGSYGVCFNPAP